MNAERLLLAGVPLALAAAVLALGTGSDPGERGPKLPAFGHASPVYGGTVLVAEEDDIRTLDPAIAYDGLSWPALHLIFDQLLQYDEAFRFQPALAEAYEVADGGRRYTFRLREGVRFHNGRAVTAEDVRYSIERLFDPKVASPGSTFFGVIEGTRDILEGKAEHASGIRVQDEHTISFTLPRPDRTFLNVVAMPFGSVIPREEVEARGAEWKFRPVGTGPFRLKEWRLGEKLVFEANRDYWEKGIPYVDRIVNVVNFPRAVQFLKFEAGELHQLNLLTNPDYLWIRSQEAWRPYLTLTPQADTFGEMMNTEMPPFDNKKLRQAVALSIDREKIRKLRAGRALPANGFLPPSVPGFEERFGAGERWQVYDPVRAKRLMAEAGYPDGYPEPIEYWTLASEASLMIAQSVQQDLQAIGIRIDIKAVTFPVYLTAGGRRKTVRFGYAAWLADFPDPFDFLDVKFNSANIAEENSSNDSFYKNPEVDRLLEAAKVEMDEGKRLSLYRQAHAIVVEDAPYAFEYHQLLPEAVQPVLRGYKPSLVWGRDLVRVWLDTEEGRPSP